MHVLQIGQTSIPYTVRYSSRTKHQRLVVTPEAVEVVAHELVHLLHRHHGDAFWEALS